MSHNIPVGPSYEWVPCDEDETCCDESLGFHAHLMDEESGKAFIAAIMEVQGREVPDYRGMFSTFLNGYVLTFDLTARE